MTNPKLAERYPDEYVKILRVLDEDTKAVVTLRCPDLKKAQGLRKRIYDFRRAVVKDPTMERLHWTANKITIKFEKHEHGVNVLVMHQDGTPEVEMLKAALVELGKEDI